ncbi:MAG: DnaD domain protein [Clostridia bacterium]|nr:DnaD domain protein [Clostridia bacterium]
MSCSFSKEFSKNAHTAVENVFITEYMPNSSENAVKVYLYGLFLCGNPDKEAQLEDIAKTLDLTEKQVTDCFYYWEEFGLVSVLSTNPLNVSYLPISSLSRTKPRKIKAEKYTDFTKSLQILLPTRMISTSEYTDYFNIMETYAIKPEAMLMIIKYCVDIKGNEIGHKYISTVAKDFGQREINTVDKVEKQLADYVLRTSELSKILQAMGVKRLPEVEDSQLLKKWINELNFDVDAITFTAKSLKKGSMEKLNELLLKLYNVKCFTKEDIKNYLDSQKSVYELTIKINKALGIYEEVLSTEIDTYVNKWLSFGFTSETLSFIASKMYVQNKKSLSQMDEFISYMRGRGFIDLTSVNDYFEGLSKTDLFIRKILLNAGINRRPIPWDTENLDMWKSWNFSDEMILEAAKLACGKSSPIQYMNGVLSNWKNNGIFTVEGISDRPETNANQSQEEYNLEYERRRNLAVTKAQKNTEKAMKLEGLADFLTRINSIEKDLAFAEIANNLELVKSLEFEKISVTEKAQNLLKTIGLTIEDLSPKYACPKCNDTGYVGTHRCDCYSKK